MSGIFTDNFNSYSDGDLDGQGSWTRSAGGHFQVENDVAEGTHGVSCIDDSLTTVYKDGTARTSGNQVFYTKVTTYPVTGGSRYWRIRLVQSTGGGSPYLEIEFNSAHNITLNGNTIQTYNENTWYEVQVQWRNSPDYRGSVNINKGGWSNWYSGSGNWTTGLDRIQISRYYGSGHTDPTYIDYIAESTLSLPSTTITSNPPTLTNSTSATFEFTSDTYGATFETNLDSAGWVVSVSPKSYTSLSSAEHNFKVRAKDMMGRYDDTPAEYSWEVDTDPPSSTIDIHPTDPSGPDVHFEFSCNEPDSTFETKIDVEGWESLGTSDTKDYVDLAHGEHTFYVRATDLAGNTETSYPSNTWDVYNPPYIDLDWTDASGNELGFKIERKVGPSGTWEYLDEVGEGITTYHDVDIEAGETYYYRVYAYNGTGSSTYSNEASDTVPE